MQLTISHFISISTTKFRLWPRCAKNLSSPSQGPPYPIAKKYEGGPLGSPPPRKPPQHFALPKESLREASPRSSASNLSLQRASNAEFWLSTNPKIKGSKTTFLKWVCLSQNCPTPNGVKTTTNKLSVVLMTQLSPKSQLGGEGR